MAGTDVIVVHLDGEYQGWHATMRTPARISARVLIDLESESNAKKLTAYGKMILSVEGWQDCDGNPTSDALEGPLTALNAAAEKWAALAGDVPKE
jgi:hypothetical protein